MICTSANTITEKVRKLHTEKLGFLTRAEFLSLDSERFEIIHSLILGNKPVFKPLSPRPHQIRAIAKSENFFDGLRLDRGKIIHPCGSGKSLLLTG